MIGELLVWTEKFQKRCQFYRKTEEGDTMYLQVPVKVSFDGHNFWKRNKEVLAVLEFIWGDTQTYQQNKIWGLLDFKEGYLNFSKLFHSFEFFTYLFLKNCPLFFFE